MEVQGRVVRDHASNAGGESVRSPPRQSPPHPPTVLCDQVTVKLIVLVEYSYWRDNGCSRVYLRMEDMFASIHCINFTWSVVFRRWRREGEGWLSQCNQARWSYPPEIKKEILLSQYEWGQCSHLLCHRNMHAMPGNFTVSRNNNDELLFQEAKQTLKYVLPMPGSNKEFCSEPCLTAYR